jgi:hypothetical protein
MIKLKLNFQQPVRSTNGKHIVAVMLTAANSGSELKRTCLAAQQLALQQI